MRTQGDAVAAQQAALGARRVNVTSCRLSNRKLLQAVSPAFRTEPRLSKGRAHKGLSSKGLSPKEAKRLRHWFSNLLAQGSDSKVRYITSLKRGDIDTPRKIVDTLETHPEDTL